MQLRDILATELLLLASVRPVYQKAVINLHQEWLVSGDADTFSRFIQASQELAKREFLIEFIERTLKAYDEQV